MLPKFETTYAEQLNGALKNMGMAVAFDPSKADFSLIHLPPPALYVSDVEHKTYVKVDEEGTEAAAATSVVAEFASRVYPPPPPPFRVLLRGPSLCSSASPVLCNRPTSHGRACRACGLRPSPTGPAHHPRRATVGSPSSRVESFHACAGPPTARDPAAARVCRRRRCCLPPRLTTSASRST